MTKKKLFYQKIALSVIIVVLLIPIYILGGPAQRKPDGTTTLGGMLASQRAEAGLAEANLGKIDPAGSAMKLATFGMRGVAVSLLWHRSQEYEKRADWDNVVATANQIITLEPHFITIWDFVGWQLAYNASAMFDDYRERYRWVIRGFNFVQDGTVYNRTAPKLYVRSGWTISQKVGIADEKVQYRRLFRKDDEFDRQQRERNDVYVSNRDNWLLGHAFYKRAEELYENGGDIGNETRLLFYGRAVLNCIRYAEWMSIDGCGESKDDLPFFDVEHCKAAWKKAEDEWNVYQSREVTTTIEDREKKGTFRKTSLIKQREAADQIREYEKTLESFFPEGVTRESVVWDRWNNILDDKQRAAAYESVLNPPEAENYNLGKGAEPQRIVRDYLDGKYGEQPEWKDWRKKLLDLRLSYVDESLRELAVRPRMLISEDQDRTYSSAFEKLNDWQGRALSLLKLTPETLASYVTEDKRAEAADIVDEINKLANEESFSRMFRDIMGADFHEAEVKFEQEENAREARRHRRAVRDLYRKVQFEDSNKEFLACFDSWVALLHQDEFKSLAFMPQMQTELMEELEKYVIVLEQLEEIFPKEFAFQEVIRRDERVKMRLEETPPALAFVEKELADGKYQEAVEDSLLLMQLWDNFYNDEKPFALGPLPETVDSYFDAVRLWVRAYESNPSSNELEIARQSGEFANYPGKVFLEFMIQKRDDDYARIREIEVERMNNPDDSFKLLEEAVGLWAKIVERAPVLKYDETSELNGRIQNAVQEYYLELQKQNKPVPEDFPLKDFPSVSR